MRWPILLAAIVAAPLAADAAVVGTTGNGATVEVTGFAKGVLRLRLHPKNTDTYEVSDVVVGADVPVSHTCDGAVCTVVAADADGAKTTLVVTIGEAGVKYAYRRGGEDVSTGDLFFKEGTDEPNGSLAFPGAQKLYGIPERAIDLALETDKSRSMARSGMP